MKIRILSLIIFFHMMLIAVKISFVRVNDLDSGSVVAEIGTTEAYASSHASAEEGKKEKPKPTAPSSTQVKTSTQKPSQTHLLTKDCGEYNLDLLQALAQRRRELENWYADAENRQLVLTTAENRLNQKLTELTNLKDEVKILLDNYNEKDNEKIKNLVKIYENMKPQDAANIFEQLDMQVLLQVIGNMKETKVAPILAKMNPAKAKDVTLQFAQQKRLMPPQN